jgi:hypothetical protein
MAGHLSEGRPASASFNTVCVTNDISCTGSVTFGNGTTVAVPFSRSQGFEASVTKTGWTVGGGIEGAVPDTHLILRGALALCCLNVFAESVMR